MPQKPSKRMNVLRSYEELTRKETLCLKEGNYGALLATQKKKAMLLRGLDEMREQPFEPGEAADFKTRIAALQKQEAENAELLAERMKVNREQLRSLTRNAKSGTSALKAYGRPEEPVVDKSSALKDRA